MHDHIFYHSSEQSAKQTIKNQIKTEFSAHYKQCLEKETQQQNPYKKKKRVNSQTQLVTKIPRLGLNQSQYINGPRQITIKVVKAQSKIMHLRVAECVHIRVCLHQWMLIITFLDHLTFRIDGFYIPQPCPTSSRPLRSSILLAGQTSECANSTCRS